MKPLEGVKIVDFTQAHAGSLATMILSDFGAEVKRSLNIFTLRSVFIPN